MRDRYNGEMRRTFTQLMGLPVFVGLLTGCVGDLGQGSTETEDIDVAKDGLCVVDTPIRRLTRFEYNNTVRDLLGDTTEPANVLPPEEEVHGFDNQAAALTVSEL